MLHNFSNVGGLDRRCASIKPVTCHRAFIFFSQMTSIPFPNGSASYEMLVDPLPEDGTANFHRQNGRICLLSVEPSILQSDLLSALPRDA